MYVNPREHHSTHRPSNESKIMPVRPLIAALSVDYVASNLWALQDPYIRFKTLLLLTDRV